MAEVIRMPRMSDTMTEGVIESWQKKVGDAVKPGDVLAEVETDKATMELESYTEGTLLYIGPKADEAVPVEGVLAIIGKPGEDYKPLLEKAQAASEGKSEAVEPAKTQEASAIASKAPSSRSAPQTSEEPQAPGEISEGERLKASPLARKMAEEKGISLENIHGSGDNGRIVKRDIDNYTPTSQKVAVHGEEGYEDVKLSQMRKTIARRLSESKFSAPHYYLTIAVNMDKAIEARKAINYFLPEKISFNDIIIKATAAALARHPKVNASWMEDAIRYYKHIHIGVAIAVEEGLVVPVIKFAAQKSLSTLSEEVKEYAQKAKARKLQPTDFEGNTFTISNLGMFGIEQFTAIINPPDACILAIGAIETLPIVKDGKIVVGNIMKMTLSCDHRVVDGATGAQFLQTLKQFLEEPVTILA